MNQRKYEKQSRKSSQNKNQDLEQNPKRRWSKQDTPRNYDNINKLQYSFDYSTINNKYLQQIRNNTKIKQLIAKQKLEQQNSHLFKIQQEFIPKPKWQNYQDSLQSMINQQKYFAYLDYQAS
ncbi:unnamed protein product [Paramecium primaurelia]|uniref:Uncharacterized protein n=2 Tax=Paramecium TaxID=5884 RepID=A0A8S1RW28_9CILI|nr:unnamed protein product [Paramecium primaurelia]CAD8131620.1 unnamed protein product [Paramecium pentaurelia]